MRFTKMQGLGNDYLYLDFSSSPPPDLSRLAAAMSDRHFGAGADGLIAVGPGVRGDFSMEMYNADGSRGEMCGNGIRCLGKYVYDRGLTRKTSLLIDTPAGPRAIRLHLSGDRVESVTADMGCPEVSPPLSLPAGGRAWEGVPVSMGNPHFVVFCSDPEAADLAAAGPVLERDPHFPGRTNVEFARLGPEGLSLRVWERGSGETLACGTGACAAFAAARARLGAGDALSACLPGGTLSLRWEERSGHILMTGPAVTVYEGEWPD